MAVKTEMKNCWGMPDDLPSNQAKPGFKQHIPLASQSRPIRKGSLTTVPKDISKQGDIPKN